MKVFKNSYLAAAISLALCLWFAGCAPTPTAAPTLIQPSATALAPTLTPRPTLTATAAASPSPQPSVTPTLSGAEFCEQVAATHQPINGFQTYCDEYFGFALDYPIGWEITQYTSAPDGRSAPERILQGMMFGSSGLWNYIRVETFRLAHGETLEQRVTNHFSYAERAFSEKDYATLQIGGQRAYVVLNRWHQDYSGVTLFFQHGVYYTTVELKLITEPGLDTNWQIATSIQTRDAGPEQNVIPEELVKDSYLLPGLP